MATAAFKAGTVRDDLEMLDKTLKRLRTEYELYISQAVKFPPNQRQAEVEAIVRHYTKNPPSRTVDRFRFNTLVHRYRTNLELWRRRVRKMEQQGHTGARQGGRAAEDPNAAHTVASLVVRDDTPGGDQLRDLYTAYRNARRARGLPVSQMAYSKFAKSMSKHLQAAKGKARGKDLELRVDAVGGKVRIAVRPTEREKA